LPDGNHGKTASGVAQGVEYYQEGVTAQKELLQVKDGKYHKKTIGYFGQELSNP
jgi:hypothetical protein